MLVLNSLRALNSLQGRDLVMMLGDFVGACGHKAYQAGGPAKSSHRDAANSICRAVASPFLRSQGTSYKTCLFGIVYLPFL